jgi:CubicO group peptidase (beta-lactamase class C family)
MHEHVLAPTGMRHTTYQMPLTPPLWGFAAAGHLDDGSVMEGRWRAVPELAAGGAWSTASDLAQFVIALQESIAGKDGALLPKPLAVEMTTRQMDESGLGLFIGGEGEDEYFFHTGHNTGYRAILVGFLHSGRGAVILANSDASTQLIFEVLRSIAVAYDWPAYRPAERTLGVADPSRYPAYVGGYELFPGVTAEITTDGERLFIKAPPLGREPVELFPETSDKFFVTVDAVAIEFARDPNGEVQEMLVDAPGRKIRARRATSSTR